MPWHQVSVSYYIKWTQSLLLQGAEGTKVKILLEPLDSESYQGVLNAQAEYHPLTHTLLFYQFYLKNSKNWSHSDVVMGSSQQVAVTA